MSTKAFFWLVFITVLSLTLFSVSVAVSGEKDCSPPGLQPGDEGYQHCKFHDVYQDLRRTYGEGRHSYNNSCCNGLDCRVTKEFRSATKEQEENGYDYQVFVDGKWCPVARSSLVTLSPEQRLRAPYDPHLQEFMRHNHVCASSMNSLPNFFWDTPVPQDRSKLKELCPVVHCIFEGGAKS